MTPNWIIERLYVKPTVDGFQNVVITADWRCNGSEQQEGREFAGTCYGQTSFPSPDPAAFTDFEKLTQEDVMSWLFASGIDKNAVEASVQNQIDNQINPPIISPPLPWATV